jgi:hypothetical protein
MYRVSSKSVMLSEYCYLRTEGEHENIILFFQQRAQQTFQFLLSYSSLQIKTTL